MRCLPNDKYTVGWICALPVELTAARAVLDEEHDRPNDQLPSDWNNYCLGRIESFNIVIACLPVGGYGIVSAAVVATRMLQTFQAIKFGLMVGIGGGVPSEEADIRLGDVVVSKPTGSSGGVIQFDFGKEYGNGIFKRVGSLNRPPEALLTAIAFLQTEHLIKGNKVATIVEDALQRYPNLAPKFCYQGKENDILFQSGYDHIDGTSCSKCNAENAVRRSARDDTCPVVHFGLIASGNQVMKNGTTRERLRKELDVICFEMEAAGLMNALPCLVIRGICDYADSHKNKDWQEYASLTAAAFAKEVLAALPMSNQGTVTDGPVPLDTSGFENNLVSILKSSGPEQINNIFNFVVRQVGIPGTPVNLENPKFYWVFKNKDYQTWVQNNPRYPILSITAPHYETITSIGCTIKRVVESQNPRRVILSLSWIDLFGSSFPVTAFIQTIMSHLLHISPAEEKMGRMVQFLRGVLNNASDTDKRAFYEKQAQRERALAFKQLAHEVLSLSSANLWCGLEAALVDRVETLFVIVHSDRYCDYSFVGQLRSIMESSRSNHSKVRVLITGITNPKFEIVSKGTLNIRYDKERQDCLSTLRFDNTRYGKIPESYKDSLQWFSKHEQFKQWFMTSKSGVLYIEGKPGSGKSTLMRHFRDTFTKHLRDHVLAKLSPESEGDQTILSDFFYSYRDGDRERSHQNMLRSLLWDILSQDESFFYHYQSDYRARLSASRGSVEWETESLKRVFLSMTTHPIPKTIYLAIDALDESEEHDRRSALAFLLSLCSQSRSCVFKIIMASRPITEIYSNVLGVTHLNKICLQDETASDIRRYAQSFLGPELNFSGKLLIDATEYIANTAQGVFLWVRLIQKELQACVEKGYRKREIFEMLLSLPTELEAFYIHMLSQLDNGSSRDVDDGRRMLQMVIFARRSLTVSEMQHALAIDSLLEQRFDLTDESLEDELIQLMENRIIHCTGNFLEIKDDKSVQIIHQTVREFFLPSEAALRRPRPVAVSRFQLRKENDAHLRMAIICLACIQMIPGHTASNKPRREVVNSWTQSDYDEYATYLNSRPFLRYVLSFLPYHLAKLPRDRPDGNSRSVIPASLENNVASYLLADYFERNSNHVLPAFREMVVSASFKSKILHSAARLGLENTVAMTLQLNGNVDAIEDHKTPLLVAVEYQHEETARILLGDRPYTNDRDHRGRGLFHMAAEKGSMSIFKMLHLSGGDVNTKDKNGVRPHHLAAGNGHTEILKYLLWNGAVVDARDDSEHWTALHWASYFGQVSTIEHLLNVCDTQPSASREGSHPESHSLPMGIVNFVLEKDRKRRSSIHLASLNGHTGAVRALLHHGAEPFKQDKEGYTPLILASMGGHEETVRLLAESHPKLCLASDFIDRCAISHAAIYGHDSVISLLVEFGGRLDGQDRYGLSPLHLAAQMNQTSTIRLLIELGSHVNPRDVGGRTPLHWTAYKGHIEATKALIDLGVEVAALDEENRDALFWAAGIGNEAIVKILLLQAPESVNSRDWRGWTPLFWAAGNGHKDVVQLLIDGHVDVNAADANGLTALHWAIRKKQTQPVLLLLKHGANFRQTDGNGMDATEWAREFGGNSFLQLFSLSSMAIDNEPSGQNLSIGTWLKEHGYEEHMLGM